MLFQVSFYYCLIIRKLDFNFRFKAVGTVLEITVGIVKFSFKFDNLLVFQKLMSCCVPSPVADLIF
jgi:hypothetical protein